MSLRRAALRRDRPSRGAYEPGEWVMIWKVHLNQGSWIGPAKVIIQEGASTVFCNNSGSLIRAAPEHVRPVSAVEAQLIPFEEQVKAHVNPSAPSPRTNSNNVNNTSIIPTDNTSNATPTVIPNENPPRPNSPSSSDQPDQEPENPENAINTPSIAPAPTDIPDNPSNNPELEPHEIPIPADDDDELLLWYCAVLKYILATYMCIW